MKAKYQLKLEDKINEFLEDVCDDYTNENPGFFHDDLTSQMADAAANVMDAAFDAQKYANDNGTK